MAPLRRRIEDDRRCCCSPLFLKCLMLFFALLTTICGGLFLTLSGYLFLIKYYIVPLLHTEMFMYCIYLMCLCGSLCLVTGFCSCSAAKSRCGNTVYLFLLILLVSCEGLLVYTALNYTVHSTQNVALRLKNDVRYGYVNDANIRWAIDKLQIESKCCGSKGFFDYPKNKTSTESEEVELSGRRKPVLQYVPDSCCRNYKPGCGQSDHPSNINYNGCSVELEREMHNSMYFISTAAFAFLIIQSLTTFVTLLVCASWKGQPDTNSLKYNEQQMHLFD